MTAVALKDYVREAYVNGGQQLYVWQLRQVNNRKRGYEDTCIAEKQRELYGMWRVLERNIFLSGCLEDHDLRLIAERVNAMAKVCTSCGDENQICYNGYFLELAGVTYYVAPNGKRIPLD